MRYLAASSMLMLSFAEVSNHPAKFLSRQKSSIRAGLFATPSLGWSHCNNNSSSRWFKSKKYDDLFHYYFISEKNSWNRCSVWKGNFGVKIRFPFDNRVECLRSRHIKHNKGTYCLFIIDPSHVSKSFLSWKDSISIFTFKKPTKWCLYQQYPIIGAE